MVKKGVRDIIYIAGIKPCTYHVAVEQLDVYVHLLLPAAARPYSIRGKWRENTNSELQRP